MVTSLLRLAQVCAGYGDLEIVRNVDLDVAAGEYVAILGSNGAGKSTLLKVIAGLLPARDGEIYFQGQAVRGLPASGRVERGISLVPEGRRLFAGMTVRENLVMGTFRHWGAPDIALRLDAVLAIFPALREKLQQVAGTLSGGEQQMCAMGRALMGNPALLLIDELSFGLAPALTERLLEAVSRINRSGTAIVLVEQDVLAALRHATRGYVMSGGRVVGEGQTAVLLADAMIQQSYLGVSPGAARP